MSANRQPKRPGPDAYDHLWSLLPVFAAFFAVIVFAAAADDRPAQHGHTTAYVPLQASYVEPALDDPSVPPAAEAMARLPDSPSEQAPSF